LATKVRAGRKQSIAQFPSFASRAVQASTPDPGATATFESAKLDWAHELLSLRGQSSLALHSDLLQLRRTDPALSPGAEGIEVDGVALSDTCLLLRWFSEAGRDRLLIVNLGRDVELNVAPEPLLAPPERGRFRLMWSSEALRYGGLGVPDDVTDDEGFRLPAYSACLYEAVFCASSGDEP
jgi:maltooligosyltrehalose trehalohydrolase